MGTLSHKPPFQGYVLKKQILQINTLIASLLNLKTLHVHLLFCGTLGPQIFTLLFRVFF